ncbi:MAG TPA: hypothetical protein VJB16_01365, partial [archaeon]|nr:hypothetical protein [archaeon]
MRTAIAAWLKHLGLIEDAVRLKKTDPAPVWLRSLCQPVVNLHSLILQRLQRLKQDSIFDENDAFGENTSQSAKQQHAGADLMAEAVNPIQARASFLLDLLPVQQDAASTPKTSAQAFERKPLLDKLVSFVRDETLVPQQIREFLQIRETTTRLRTAGVQLFVTALCELDQYKCEPLQLVLFVANHTLRFIPSILRVHPNLPTHYLRLTNGASASAVMAHARAFSALLRRTASLLPMLQKLDLSPISLGTYSVALDGSAQLLLPGEQPFLKSTALISHLEDLISPLLSLPVVLRPAESIYFFSGVSTSRETQQQLQHGSSRALRRCGALLLRFLVEQMRSLQASGSPLRASMIESALAQIEGVAQRVRSSPKGAP